MYKQVLSITTVAILIGLSGCVGRLVPFVELDNKTLTNLRKEVIVYDSEQLPNIKYKRLGTIEGYSCMYWEWGPRSSREEAIDQLRYRASALGGNGIANLACTEEGLSFAKNCYNSVTCNAVAIQLEPTGHTPSVASGEVSKTPQSAEQVKKQVEKNIDAVGSQDVEQLQAGVVKITAKSSGGTPKGGTGFIVRLDRDVAYIVTAAHVVAGDPQPKVEFFTKRNLPVLTEVLGLEGDDEVRGLALLVVRGEENLPKGLRALPLAETRRFSGGEDIIMIGFPRNAGPWAVVRGNISSRQGRDLYFSPTVDSGHSGGPILQSGKVVGLVAVAGQSSGRGVIARSVHDYVEGFGITVEDHIAPASLESSDNVLVSLKVQELDETLRREFNIPGNTRGVVINYIVPGSPAAAAGLERGDVIVEINHIGVKHLSQYHSVASNITQREMVMLLLNRRGNELFIAVQP